MHDTGKVVLGLGLFAGLVTGPVWYGAGGGKGEPPVLERPLDAKECIEPTPFMRARHMEMLDAWREAVVRRDEREYLASNGQRHQISLTGTCLGCHTDPAKFCDRCHQYAAVEAFCWDCHHRKRRGT
jgi:hypothetical protein